MTLPPKHHIVRRGYYPFVWDSEEPPKGLKGLVFARDIAATYETMLDVHSKFIKENHFELKQIDKEMHK